MSDRSVLNSDKVHHLRRVDNSGWINLNDLRELVAAAEGLDGGTTVYVSGMSKLVEDPYSIRDLSRYSAKSIWVEPVGRDKT